MRDGHTLFELLVLLAVTAVVMAVAVPAAGRIRDVHSVRAARDATVNALSRARMHAIASGRAALVLDLTRGVARVETAAGPVGEPLLLERDFGVTVASAGADSVRIEYDALGLGRVASRTLAFERGGARAGLSIASYGRVRRW